MEIKENNSLRCVILNIEDGVPVIVTPEILIDLLEKHKPKGWRSAGVGNGGNSVWLFFERPEI